MKCKYCESEMICVDDSGSYTQLNHSWDYYICPGCKADVNVTKNDSKEVSEWNQFPILKYSHLGRLEDGIEIEDRADADNKMVDEKVWLEQLKQRVQKIQKRVSNINSHWGGDEDNKKE